jgi:hypothetical protein
VNRSDRLLAANRGSPDFDGQRPMSAQKFL